ncbi:MAG: DegT/DnrJ/EryC1/StrS family aminotransferase [Holosporales bacterium]|nr:DegT/DnrJ/EryC1/StrS family aminotransferase [Holosporales bacterium]
MRKIRLSAPWFSEAETEAVARVLRTQVVNMGEEVKLFEEELHKFFARADAKVTCVHSCTAALQLSVQACGIGIGDEVLVPTYTFVASFQAVKANGAIPVPCDVDPNTGFLDIDDAKKRLTSKTKAIMPVLFAGCSSGIDDVYQFASENGLAVIEDAAHSFGDQDISKRNGILCFSFDPIKNISCGDGGCVLTTQDTVTDKLKDLRLLGVEGDTDRRFLGQRSWDTDVKTQGWRLHMNNIAAAIGRAQLARFSEIKARRLRNSETYVSAFSALEEVKLLPINTETAVPHIFPILVKNQKRNALKAFLDTNGIETGVQYKPNHLLTYFNLGYDLPNSMKLYGQILSIPLHPLLSEDDVTYVTDKVLEFFSK